MFQINLADIPSGNVYLRLNSSFFNQILSIIRKSNTILSEGVRSQLYRISRGNKVSLSFVKHFSEIMEFDMEDFQRNTELITSAKFTNVGIKNPRFPINFSTKDGVRFIAAIMGDGELNSQLNVRYNNQNEHLIELVEHSAKRIFGDVDKKLYLRKDKTYQLHFPKIIGIIVSLLGIKPGYKSESNYGIPSFIFGLDTGLQAIFIRQFYNDEANVRLKDRRLQVKQTCVVNVPKSKAKANPELYAHKALVDIRKILRNFNIESKLSLGTYRGKKADWELSIYRIENLKLFRRYIGFDVIEKNDLLDIAIKSYKFPSSARGGRIDFALDCARKVQNKYRYVDKHLLSKESNRSLKVATYYLVDLKKMGLVKCIEKPIRNGKPISHRYILV